MSRGEILMGTLLVLWTITAPIAAVDATAIPTHSEASLSPIDKMQHTTGVPAQSGGNEALFKEIEKNDSSFVVKINMSLFTTLFEPGSVLRIVTGGTAYGERVVWFDIGIARGQDGFETQSNMMINIPYL